MAEKLLTLHPAVRPALAAGSYELRTNQTISSGSLGTRTVESRTHRIEVTAPRTSMDPGEVFGVFPPPHAQGPFEARLPHITLASPHAAVGALGAIRPSLVGRGRDG